MVDFLDVFTGQTKLLCVDEEVPEPKDDKPTAEDILRANSEIDR